MTHELLDIVSAYENYRSKGISCLMVTLVHLEGSSYRKPGVRMLIAEDHSMVGAVSGGCVEKEILSEGLTDEIIKIRSIEAFMKLSNSNNSKVIITDGKAPFLIETKDQ